MAEIRVYEGLRLVYTQAEQDREELEEHRQNRVTAEAYIKHLHRRLVETQERVEELEALVERLGIGGG